MDFDITQDNNQPLIQDNSNSLFYQEKKELIRRNEEKEETKELLESHNEEFKVEDFLSKIQSNIQEKEKKEQKSYQVSYTKILMSQANSTDKLLMLGGYLSAILTGLGIPTYVLLFGDVLDSFGTSGKDIIESIIPSVIQLLVIGVIVWITSYLYFAFLITMAERVTKKTRLAYLRSILQQDISWFDNNETSALSANLSRECFSIDKALGEKMGTILLSLAMTLSGTLLSFVRGWIFSLILLVPFPAIYLATHLITVVMQSGFMQNLKSYSQSAGYAEQALNAIRVVQAFGQEKLEQENYEKYLSRARKTGIQTHFKIALVLGAWFFVMYGYHAYGFYTGSWLITKEVYNSNTGQNYTSGDILACFFGIFSAIFSLGMATPNIKAITEGRVCGKNAYDVIERKPKILLDEKNKKSIKDLKGRIEFKNVTFGYSKSDQLVLNEFSAIFEEGKTTAIVGSSGSGKSTIIQLIERFYDPNEGEILIDGDNIKQLNLRELRKNIGYVGQEPVLFNLTIRENLLYGDPNATDIDIIQALKSANAWDFIRKKMGEKGINTQVGGAGGQLSGGQKQRIAIARAFIKKPKILLFDEATSALDKRNERKVQQAIDQIRQDLGSVTTIVVAHRLSTIRKADKIIVMQQGRIIEQGNHFELLENYPQGLYAKYIQEQNESEQHENPEDQQDGNQSSSETEIQQMQTSNELLRMDSRKRSIQSNDQIDKLLKEKHDKIDEEKD